jgi:hypothetical protein
VTTIGIPFPAPSSAISGLEPGLGATGLDPADWSQLRALGHRMIDDTFDHLAGLRAGPPWRKIPESERGELRSSPLPHTGAPPEAIYEDFRRLAGVEGMSQHLADNRATETAGTMSQSPVAAPCAGVAAGLERLFIWYVWSVWAAVGIFACCVAVAVIMPFGDSVGWVAEPVVFWILHPLKISAWCASVIFPQRYPLTLLSLDDPLGQYDSDWRTAFVIAQDLLSAVVVAISIWLFHSGKAGTAISATILAAFYNVVAAWAWWVAVVGLYAG